MTRPAHEFLAIAPHGTLSLSPLPGDGPHIQDLIDGDDGNNSLPGTENDDTIRGFGGNDFAYGYGGADTIYGGSGNDGLYGGLDFDTIYGGTGDDTIQGVEFGAILSTSGPSDVIAGGGGVDLLIVNYAGWVNSGTFQPVNVTVSMATGSGEVLVDGFRGENFSEMERLNFTGAEGNDNATGGALDDVIDGRGGNDVLDAGDGDDIVKDTWGSIDADGGDGNDTLWLFGYIFGHEYGDTTIDAGAGTVNAGANASGTFANFENLTVYTGTGTDTIAGFSNGINNFYGAGTGAKTFTGGDLNDYLQGADGSDNLYGGQGNDIFGVGNGGHDMVYGGGGNDTTYGGGSTGWFYGGGGDDNLNGAGNGASFDGGAGDDIIFLYEPTPSIGTQSFLGGTGDDDLVLYWTNASLDFTGATIDVEELRWVDYNSACTLNTIFTTAQFLAFDQIILGTENRYDDQFTITLADNSDVVLHEISQFMRLRLNDAGQMVDMRGVGTDWVPWIEGGAGNDEVFAPEFAAALFKAWLGGGNDKFHGSYLNEQADGGDGNDNIDGSYGNDKLYGGEGKDKLFGGVGNDHVDDILNGGAGADKLEGGNGADKYVYKKASDSTGAQFDTVTGFDAQAVDVFDIKGSVTGIDTKVTTGALSKATFNADLEAALDDAVLAIDHAILFTPDAGGYAGKTFLVVNVNGHAGYDADKDLVILLNSPKHIGALDPGDFV